MSDIAAAERIAGLAFTPAERRQMQGRLHRMANPLAGTREAGLTNDEPPALTFDPRLPGMRFDHLPTEGVRSRRRPPRLSADDESIAFAPVTRLSRWIEGGTLTSERLTSIYLERLQTFGPRLHCVATLMEREALRDARRADREIARGHYRGPLHGIPWGAKDLLDTKGVQTAWGAEPYLNRVPDRDAAVVARLREAGAILVAKLSMGALAMGDVWYGGRTTSPWNTDEGASGSSAGSGAAVAAGLVGFAIGTETHGSIVSPSLRNGVTGLRPTFGRVSRRGAMALAWSLDKIGPMTRTVEDAALVLEAITGPHDPGEPQNSVARDRSVAAMPYGFDANRSARGLRVGYEPKRWRGRGSTAGDREVLARLRAAGVALVPVVFPVYPSELLGPGLLVEAAAALQSLTLSGEDDLLTRQDDDAWPNGLRAAHLLPAVEVLQASRLRFRAMVAMRDLFDSSRVDVLISPFGNPTADLDTMLAVTNGTGHPALALRQGFRRNGTPWGAVLWGRLYDEGTLIRVGMALEHAADCWQARPPL